MKPRDTLNLDETLKQAVKICTSLVILQTHILRTLFVSCFSGKFAEFHLCKKHVKPGLKKIEAKSAPFKSKWFSE